MIAVIGDAPVRLAIDLDDPVLADRISSILDKVDGIEIVEAGDSPELTIAATSKSSLTPNVSLTDRELEVLSLLAEGSSNKLIARRLGISAHTAKFHVRSLLQKLDAVSRTDAVALAARLGVISL